MNKNINKLDVINNCPLCGKKDVQHLMDSSWVKSDRPLLEMLEMDYLPASWSHCHACNHVFLNPSFSVDVENKLYGVESIYRKYSIAGRTDEQYLIPIDSTINNKSMLHAGHLGRLKYIKAILNVEKIVCVDFGAGFGSAERTIESLGWNYYGFEIDAWCLNKANELGRTVKPDLPECIRDGGADLVYSSQVFEHIKNPNDVAEFIKAILKPGGYIYINVPTHAYALSALSSIGTGGLNCMNWGHYHSYTPESLSHMLSSWGFVIVKVWLKNGDVNILAKKQDAFDPPVHAELISLYSTAAERLKIQMQRWILNPAKLLLIGFPVNALRVFVPKFFKEYVRNAWLENR